MNKSHAFLRMNKNPLCSFQLASIKTRPITTSAMSFNPSENVPVNHKQHCFALAEQLIKKGMITAAQGVLDRIVNVSSLLDAIFAANFAAFHGLNLDSSSYGTILRKIASSGQFHAAQELYCHVARRGIVPDPSFLNSMTVCCCKLGKSFQAKTHLNQLIKMGYLPSKFTYSTLLRELCLKQNFSMAVVLFFEMLAHGLLPCFSSHKLLINGLCSRDLEQAIRVYNAMIDNGTKPTPYLYKSLIYYLCKSGWVQKAGELCIRMESQGLVPNRVVYTSLIYLFCKAGEMEMALGVFCRMWKLGCEPDVYAFNTLIYGFLELGCLDSGWNCFDQMVHSGLKPDVVTYSIIICRYCKDMKLDCALLLMDKMLGSGCLPNLHCYTVLISSLYKGNRFVEADELFNKMLDNGYAPDRVMFRSLMNAHPKGQEPLLALKILKVVAKHDSIDVSVYSRLIGSGVANDVLQQETELLLDEIIKSNVVPAELTFNVLIKAFSAHGKTNIAFVVMDKMMGHGCEPGVSTYNTLIKCLFEENQAKFAESLIGIMWERGLVPNLSTYLIMINGHCKRRDLVSAFRVFEEMIEKGLKPTIAIYDSIIGALCKEKRMEEAEYIFNMIFKSGETPDEVVYTTLINGFAKMGRAIDACYLFDEMISHGIKPSCHTYSAVINGLIKKNMIEKGCQYLERMLEDGFAPDNVLYTMLINQFFRKGEVNFALSIFDLMVRNLIKPNLITYGSLISGVCRNILRRAIRYPVQTQSNARKLKIARSLLYKSLARKSPTLGNPNKIISCYSSGEKVDLAWKLMECIEDNTGLVPDLYIYNGMINGCCRANMLLDAYDLLDKAGLAPNHVTYTILISGHSQFGEIDVAIKLFNKMNVDGCAPDEVTYNTLLKGLCNAGRESDALSLSLTMMRKRGFVPSRVSYDKLVRCLSINGSSGLAFKLCEEMLLNGYIPCCYNYNRLLCLLCEENKVQEAHRVFDMMLKMGKALDKETKRLLVEACYKQREFDLAYIIEEDVLIYEA